MGKSLFFDPELNNTVMDLDQIRNHIEELADDSTLELTERQIKKYSNLANELQFELDISLEEIQAEFRSISPDDDDDWLEYIDAVAEFVLGLQDPGNN